MATVEIFIMSSKHYNFNSPYPLSGSMYHQGRRHNYQSGGGGGLVKMAREAHENFLPYYI